MLAKQFSLLVATAMIAGCGSSSDDNGPFGGKAGKGEATPPIDVAAEGVAEWKLYSVDREVAVGPDTREALIRVRVPRDEGMAVVAPPVIRLKVRVSANDEINSDHFRGLLYHDYYVKGPKAGTHKYMVPLDTSRALITYQDRSNDSSIATLEWRVPEVVGDSNNATTWAISFASFAPELSPRAILGVQLWFKKTTSSTDADMYETDFWPGEWPVGYQMRDDVVVKARAEANAQTPLTTCSIEAGSRFHPWKGTPVVYRTSIDRFQARVPVDFLQCDYDEETLESDCRPHRVATGDVVEQLTYLSEGWCLVRHGGVTLDVECLDMPTYEGMFLAIPGTSRPDEWYFKAPCLEGGQAWISTEDIEAFTSGDNAPVATYVPDPYNEAVVIKDSDDTSEPISVQLGQDIEVRLPANPSTGYRWVVVATDRTFGYPGTTDFLADSNLDGAPGTTVLTWKTDGFLDVSGAHSVTLEYRKEGTSEGEKTFSFTVDIF